MTTSDPLGEIGRLAGPDAPWLHLLDGASADARQLAWLLAERGVVTRVLRGYCMRSRFGLYDEIGAALQLPGDAVEDWEGLRASLTDMPWLPGRGHVLVVTSAALTLSADAEESSALWESLTEVGRRRTGEVEVGNPVPFHVVLADDAPGLALLTSRLEGAGAAFDVLAEWAPQEPAVVRDHGVRTSFVSGERPSGDLDERAAGAVREREELLSLRRASERFRGAHTSDTVVYGAVINRFDDVPDLTAALADAVAERGAQILVVSDIEAAQTPRQQDFLTAAVSVWPEPEEPEPAVEQPVVVDDEVAEAAPADDAESAAEVETAEVAEAADPDPGPPQRSSAPDGETEPDAKFEIVAANLEWTFRSGTAEPDPIDEEVVEQADADENIDGIWRCWCHDPRRDRWVRVVMSIVDGDAAAVDDARKRLVGALETAGAARCCVEVVAASDAGEAHEWLQDQSVRLVGVDPEPDAIEPDAVEPDAVEPDAVEPDAVEPDAFEPDAVEPEPEPEAEPEPEPVREAVTEPEPESESGLEAGTGADAGTGPELPAGTTFAPGPTEPDEAGRRLVEWAEETPAIVGLVTASATDGAEEREVYGVVVGEGDHDLDALGAAARVALDQSGPLIVVFAPSHKLDPVHLALYRGGNRLWRRAVERSAVQHSASFEYTKLSDFNRLEMQTGELENGVTLANITTDWMLTAGAPEPEPADQAVIEWAESTEHVIGLCRALGSYTGTKTRIYTVMIDALAEGVSAEAIANCVAPHGIDRITVLSFCPFRSISIFHQDVFRESVMLWKTDADLSPEQTGEVAPAAPPEPESETEADSGTEAGSETEAQAGSEPEPTS